jgi:hypothetical protein
MAAAAALAAGTTAATAQTSSTTTGSTVATTTTTGPTDPSDVDHGEVPPPGATVSIAPDTVAAGGTITVSGTRCGAAGMPGTVTVGLTSEGGPVTDRVVKPVDGDGRWTTSLTVPAGLHPGEYPLSARCDVAVSHFFYRGPLVRVVAAPGAKPKPRPKAPKAVTAKPRFTG